VKWVSKTRWFANNDETSQIVRDLAKDRIDPCFL
jgi:hypothetical protein